jgi:hypothetical protein
MLNQFKALRLRQYELKFLNCSQKTKTSNLECTVLWSNLAPTESVFNLIITDLPFVFASPPSMLILLVLE